MKTQRTTRVKRRRVRGESSRMWRQDKHYRYAHPLNYLMTAMATAAAATAAAAVAAAMAAAAATAAAARQ